MGRKVFQIAFVILVLLAFAKAITDYLSQLISSPDEFEFYIESTPGGSLSRTSNLTFVFAQDFESKSFKINEPINQNLIHFTPRINGTFYWVNSRTLEFLPKDPLPSDQTFFYRVNLNKIYQTKERLRVYRNKFTTPAIMFEANFDRLSYKDSRHLNIHGQISFTDQIDFKTIHQLLRAEQKGNALPVHISQGDKNLSYQFKIDGVIRYAHTDTVVLKWFSDYELLEQKTLNIPIPGSKEFSILELTKSHKDNTILTLSFSNELTDQSDSLIQIIGASVIAQNFDKNQCEIVLNDSTIQETFALSIKGEYSSKQEIPLGVAFYKKFKTNDYLPQLVNIQKAELINLNPKNTNFPIKAKNLKSVAIEVYEIPKQNVLQFLQLPKKELPKNINRVGKKLDKRLYSLEQYANYKADELISYNIPFNFIAPQKGSIIHYQVSYQSNNIIQPFKDSIIKQSDTLFQSITYTPIQAIAKITPTDTLLVHIYDLIDKQVARNAKVEVFDYQQHQLSSSQSNKYGEVRLAFTGNISFIRVSHHGYISYLKLSQTKKEEPQLSSFLEPFFFSNQPTYQAGDSIHLGLIFDPDYLKDEKNILRYELIAPNGQLLYSKVNSFNRYELSLFKHRLNNQVSNGIYKANFSLNSYQHTQTLTVNTPNRYQHFCIQDNIKENDSITSYFSKNTIFSRSLSKSDTSALQQVMVFNIGDSVKFNLPTKPNNITHVSIENKGQIISSYWKSSNNNQVNITEIANYSYWPNAIFHLTSFNLDGSISRETKVIKVNDPSRTLKPVIISKFDFASGEHETIKIKEANGKALTYFIKLSSPIDSISNNPFLHFTKTYPSSVKSFGTGNTTTLNKAKHANSGLMNKTVYNNKNHSILGPFFLPSNANNSHSLHIPNIKGDASIEIIGMGQTESYGYAKKNVNINKPIMVVTEMPFYIQPNEVLYVNTKVFINQAQSNQCKIDIRNPTNCSFINDTEFEVPLTKGQNSFEFYLALKANKVCENISFILSIEDSAQYFEEPITIPINSLNPSSTQILYTTIPPNSPWQTRITPKGFKGTNSGFVEFSSSQHLTHAFFLKKLLSQNQNNLYTKIAMCLSQINLHRINTQSLSYQDSIANEINQCLNQLTPLMSKNGQFKLPNFDEDDNANFNLLAGQLFIEALENDYWINTRILNNWIRSLQFNTEFTDITQNKNQEIIAKQLYLLSRVDKLNFKVINDLNTNKNLSQKSLLHIGLAYSNAGMKRSAKIIFAKINNEEPPQDIEGKLLTAELAYQLNSIELSNSYLKLAHEQIINGQNYSNENICHYINSSIKLSDKSRTNNAINVAYRLNKGKGFNIESQQPISYQSIPIEFTLPKTVDIQNNGKQNIFTNIAVSGIPESPGPVKNRASLDLMINYYDSSGNKFEPHSLYVDQCFQSEIIIKNNGRETFKNMVLEVPYASGWNLDVLEENSEQFYLLKAKNALINKVYYVINLKPNESTLLLFSYTAKYPGNFYLSPITLFSQANNQVWYQSKIDYSNIN